MGGCRVSYKFVLHLKKGAVRAGKSGTLIGFRSSLIFFATRRSPAVCGFVHGRHFPIFFSGHKNCLFSIVLISRLEPKLLLRGTLGSVYLKCVVDLLQFTFVFWSFINVRIIIYFITVFIFLFIGFTALFTNTIVRGIKICFITVFIFLFIGFTAFFTNTIVTGIKICFITVFIYLFISLTALFTNTIVKRSRSDI